LYRKAGHGFIVQPFLVVELWRNQEISGGNKLGHLGFVGSVLGMFLPGQSSGDCTAAQFHGGNAPFFVPGTL
jgi:hypothetical protein